MPQQPAVANKTNTNTNNRHQEANTSSTGKRAELAPQMSKLPAASEEASYDKDGCVSNSANCARSKQQQQNDTSIQNHEQKQPDDSLSKSQQNASKLASEVAKTNVDKTTTTNNNTKPIDVDSSASSNKKTDNNNLNDDDQKNDDDNNKMTGDGNDSGDGNDATGGKSGKQKTLQELAEHYLSFEPYDIPDSGFVVSGIGGRFPNADNLNELWDNLLNGRDMVTGPDDKRWPLGEC